MLDKFPHYDPESISISDFNLLTRADQDSAEEVASQMRPMLEDYLEAIEDSRAGEYPDSTVPYLGDRHVHFLKYLKENKLHEEATNEDIAALDLDQYRRLQYKQYRERLALERGSRILPEFRQDHRITYGFVAYVATKTLLKYEATIEDITKSVFINYVAEFQDQFALTSDHSD